MKYDCLTVGARFDDGRNSVEQCEYLSCFGRVELQSRQSCRHIEHWVVAVAEGLAGLVVSVPDKAVIEGVSQLILLECVINPSCGLTDGTRQQSTVSRIDIQLVA